MNNIPESVLKEIELRDEARQVAFEFVNGIGLQLVKLAELTMGDDGKAEIEVQHSLAMFDILHRN